MGNNSKIEYLSIMEKLLNCIITVESKQSMHDIAALWNENILNRYY